MMGLVVVWIVRFLDVFVMTGLLHLGGKKGDTCLMLKGEICFVMLHLVE
jgi:hypothetical protein